MLWFSFASEKCMKILTSILNTNTRNHAMQYTVNNIFRGMFKFENAISEDCKEMRWAVFVCIYQI